MEMIGWASTLVVAVAFASLLSRLFRRTEAFPLHGKTVVITGASSGIGRSLAKRIYRHSRNVTLALLDVDIDGLQSLKSELDSEAPKTESVVLLYKCDVSDEADVERTVDTIRKVIAPKVVSVLVNNAGIVHGKSVMDLNSQEIRHTFNVNILAHFWMVKALLPTMKKAESAMIVSIASVMGWAGSASLSDYCSSKFAVVGFHESLRMELRRDGVDNVRTLLVCPGAVNTGMFEGIFDGESLKNRVAKAFVSIMPLDVASRNIYDAMRRGDALLMGCYDGWRGFVFAWLPPLLNLFPIFLKDIALDLAGAVHGMSLFVGKSTNRQ